MLRTAVALLVLPLLLPLLADNVQDDEECDAIVALQTISRLRSPSQESPHAFASLLTGGLGGIPEGVAMPDPLALHAAALKAARAAAVPALPLAAPLLKARPALALAPPPGEAKVLHMIQEVSQRVERSRKLREESAALRQELLTERTREQQAKLELATLRANITQLHRRVAAAAASAHGGELGHIQRDTVLLSVAAACSVVLVISVLGCACAAASARKQPLFAPPPDDAAAPAASVEGAGGEPAVDEADEKDQQDTGFETTDTKQRKKRWRQGKCCLMASWISDTTVWLCQASVQTMVNTPVCLYQVMFGCSPQICIAGWIFAVIWGAAVAWLWYMGVVQPYLQQLLVYVYFVLGFGSLILIFLLEYSASFQAMFHMGYRTAMMFYDKIDDALESIGLDYLESDQDRRDAEEARKNSRHIEEAMNAREVKRANDSHRKPAPGTPAWILSNVRKGKAGCC